MQGLGLRWHWPRTSASVTAGTEGVPASDRKKATQVLFKAAPPGVWQGVGAPSHRRGGGGVTYSDFYVETWDEKRVKRERVSG